jgi:hypothetical protein
MQQSNEITVTLPTTCYLLTFTGKINMLLWRACNLTAFTHSSTRPVVHPFASRHERPEFNPQGATYVKPGLSC